MQNPQQPLPPPASKKLFEQTLWVWFFSILAIRLVHELQRIPALVEYTPLFTAAILLYVPLWIFHRRREKVKIFESSFKELGVSLLVFAIVSVVIFPLLEVGNRFFQDIAFNAHYVGGNYQGLLKFAFFQWVLVGIPEELFYRGYMQLQFNRLWGQPWRFLGAPIGKSLFFTSFLFALSHSLIQLHWWHFAIFFPSLVFGWLRERTGAITASSLFHALANTFSYWVVLNYR